MNEFKKENFDLRKAIHPLLFAGLECVEKTNIVYTNELNLEGYSGPLIYSPNHSNVHDFPMICRILKEHVYVLVGNDIDNGLFNTLMLKINGVIFVNRKDKKSCQEAKEKMIELLKSGHRVVMFPEGSWNLDSVNLIHDFKWGIIDIAKKANVPILPIGMKYNINDSCYTRFGKLIYVQKEDDLFEKKEELHAAMSTLVWDIINSVPPKSRATDYEEMLLSYNTYIEKCLKEFPYDIEYERSLIFNDHLYPTEIVGPTYRENSDRIYTRKRKIGG